MRSTPYNFSGSTPEDTVEHTAAEETAEKSEIRNQKSETAAPAVVTKTNWPLTIFLILLAAAIVYFFMKSKIPVTI